MIDAVCLSVLVALLLTAIVLAARPGGLLHFVAGWWQWWLIYRPSWLPQKSTGDCVLCTTFYFPGLVAAHYAARFTDAHYWALAIPFMVAALCDKLLAK